MQRWQTFLYICGAHAYVCMCLAKHRLPLGPPKVYCNSTVSLSMSTEYDLQMQKMKMAWCP